MDVGRKSTGAAFADGTTPTSPSDGSASSKMRAPSPPRSNCGSPNRAALHFELSVGDEHGTAQAQAEAQVQGEPNATTQLDLGTFAVKEGYHSFRLRPRIIEGEEVASVKALLLDGPPVETCHFNLEPRRNAASVHLAYPIEAGEKVAAFYCEMTAREDPIWSYYMACGWHRGYFGMQVNTPSERRIIFSVWDSGGEAVDRNKVSAEDRVTLIDKGEGVFTGSFGNEGTGGHSHLKYVWKTGTRQRFLVTAQPTDATHTIYAGYYFHPDKEDWMLISSWKAPKEGGWMRGLYSFSENFVGRNGHLLRKAHYGNQWIQGANGDWRELTAATFSHDPTGRKHRLDRFMGIEDNEFFLSHGGFVSGFTAYGTRFERQATGDSPARHPLPQGIPKPPPAATP